MRKILGTSAAGVGQEKDKILSPVVVGQDEVVGYETTRWLYFFSLPLMWTLALWVAIKKRILGRDPKINSFWFDGLSFFCRSIKKGAASWKALDIIYSYRFGSDGRISDFWIGMRNAQAVRNRLKLVKYLLETELRALDRNGEVRLLSVASGSAQGVIETMATLKREGIRVRTILLDLDPTAIEYSRAIAQRLGVENQITFLNKGVNTLAKVVGGFNPQVVEMIGFLEYRPDEKAVRLVSQIYQLLAPGGVFMTSSICNNLERSFLREVISWAMLYRSAEELREVIALGGFNPQSCQFIQEPHKIHVLAVCRKLE